MYCLRYGTKIHNGVIPINTLSTILNACNSVCFNIREVPRVMMIYDILHIGEKDVKSAIRQHFYKNADVKDTRIIDMLLERGYMDLEDTLLQHKQKNHLMLLIEGYTAGTDFNSKRITANSSEEEQFARWIG